MHAHLRHEQAKLHASQPLTGELDGWQIYGDTSLQGFVKNKQTLSHKKEDLLKCSYSHGNKCLLRKTRGINELVPLDTLFFTFTSQTKGRTGHLLLNFTLSLHYAVRRSGNCCFSTSFCKISTFSLLVSDSFSPSQVAACSPKTWEKSAHELTVQSDLGQQSHQGPYQRPHQSLQLAAPASPTLWSHFNIPPSMVQLSYSSLPNLFLLWWFKSLGTSDKPF